MLEEITSPVTPSKQAKLTPVAKQALATETDKEKRNWLIHLLFVRKDFDECMRVIER